MMHWDVMRCSAMQMYETTMLSNFLIHWFITNPLIIQEYLMKGNGPGRPVWYTPASVQQPNPSWVTYPISEWARHPRLSLAGKHSATHSTPWAGASLYHPGQSDVHHTGRAYPCITQFNFNNINHSHNIHQFPIIRLQPNSLPNIPTCIWYECMNVWMHMKWMHTQWMHMKWMHM